MDYKKKGDEELDLVKDDSLRVFKTFHHWSYVCALFHQVDMSLKSPHVFQVVKEEGGNRGWVPVSHSIISLNNDV